MRFTDMTGATVQAAESIAKAPLLSTLPSEAVAELVTLVSERQVEDGAFLFHEGEPADRVFLLSEGHLDVLRRGASGQEDVSLNTLGAGALFGELAVLRGEPRSAGVRARGRALVLEIQGAVFLRFLNRWPELAIAVARAAAHGFVLGERKHEAPRRAPLWVLAQGAGIDRGFEWALARAASRYLGRSGRILLLAPNAEPSLREEGGVLFELRPLSALSEPLTVLSASPEVALVLAAAPEPEALVLARQGDALVTGPRPRPPELPGGVRHLRLIDTGMPSATAVKRHRPDAPARLARLLLRRSVGLALGGGGALGLAHLGVLQALEELGIPLDFVAGTSMGAALGAIYLGSSLARMRSEMLKRARPQDWMPLVDPSFLVSGMLEGTRLKRFFQELTRVDTFEQLPLPFAALAMDIETGAECVLREGSLSDAVRASFSIPGVFTPHVYAPSPGGPAVTFVDGGFVNNVPVDVVRAMGADLTIGVHVMSRGRRRAPLADERGVLQRISSSVPTVARVKTLLQSQLIAFSRSGERQVYAADIAILPDTSRFAFWDFWKGAEISEAGHRAALSLSEQLRALPS